MASSSATNMGNVFTSTSQRERERERETETGGEQTAAMASSDAGTSSGSKYQVFLSFRGPDTRKEFTNYLYHSLYDAGIRVFLDDKELPCGARIVQSLQQAIDDSKIYIPVFSRDYASSASCLCELEQIVSNTFDSGGNKEILPIFYDVKPDDVKLKTSQYPDAIKKLKEVKGSSDEQVNAWSEALMKVDAIKGWEVTKYKDHGELIKVVVEEVIKKLKTKHRRVPEYLVRTDDQISKVTELLQIDCRDVRFVLVHGMGGIGKTTLTKVVFNKVSSHFGKHCCFLEDIRAKSLVELQKKLLSEIGAHAGTRSIDDIDDGMNRIEAALCKDKVLIVLDDVDNREQVEKLVGKGTLSSGSRILITTRNKDVWRREYPKLSRYEMEVMSDDPALELFSWHAFNKDTPSNDYNELSREIVSATGRLPLALVVIGSSLYRNKSQKQWEETLGKLKNAYYKGIFETLKISYDGLECDEKEIFLDIACFFVGEDKMSACYVWKDCGFYPYTAVDVLINKSLVKIVENNKFWMHDQLRDFGRQIVRAKNQTNREERSRMWDCQEILDAITSQEMKKSVKAMDLDPRRSNSEIFIRSEEIKRFECLEYLKLNGVAFVGNLANSLTKLSWFFWSQPHPSSNLTNMHLKNVVVLQFSDNNLIDDSKLQSFVKMARKLKAISLKGCDKITRIPDLSGCLNLESLNIDHCSNLREIDGSVGKLKCLIDMKITYCPCLKNVPEEIGGLKELKHFTVQQCDRVNRLPESIWKLKSLREVHFSTPRIHMEEQDSQKKEKEEQELKQRRRLGRVSFLLKIGVATATCLSALFLTKALTRNKKKIGDSGR